MTIRKGSGIRGAMIALVMVAALGSGPKALGAPVPGQNDDDAIVEINSEAELECLKSALKEREALGQERADELWIRCGGKATPDVPVPPLPECSKEDLYNKPCITNKNNGVQYVSSRCAAKIIRDLAKFTVFTLVIDFVQCATNSVDKK